MANSIRKEKVNDNTQVNFNASREIAYWAKKLNMSAALFQQTFQNNNYSIAKTLAYYSTKS